MVDSTPTDDPLDEAFAAYLRLCDTGELETREQFLAQFPELADQLQELMEAADMIGRVTQGDQGAEADTSRQVSPGADTIGWHVATGGDESGGDPAATLPMPNRAADDPGPTLPYDLGDYQLLDVIGRGGMGVVYRAKQMHLNRIVAVKMIRSGMLAGEAEVRRFYTEAQAAARLHHAGIVSVHQFGQRLGHHFFSMEHIEGTDLQKKINSSSLDVKDAVRYVRDVARAIHHAHQNGVLHRDLKPANVLIDKQDHVHVTDFGLAKHLDSDSSVTGSGAAVGTPHYMAPEQAGGHSDRATRQSDVYSLGAILFACVTGRPPIVSDTVMQTLLDVVHKPPPRIRSLRADAPADVETIVAKCLEKNPLKRYQSAERLADELDAYLEGRPIKARPRSAVIKTWHWLEGVPIVGALTGRRVLQTTATHLRFQAAVLLLVLMMPLVLTGFAVWWSRYRQAMPTGVEIGGGLEGGVYNDFAASLAQRLDQEYPLVVTQIVPSSGSLENRRRLLAGELDLAPMEASVITGDYLCVVAPLFYEALHVLARNGSAINSVEDLRGHRVAVGPADSGSRRTAELVFESLDLTPEVTPREVIAWQQLSLPDAPDAAVICIGRGSPLMTDLLASGKWHLVPVPNAIDISLSHPTLRPMTIDQSHYASELVPAAGIPTVGTTAFLAARDDTPGELVQAAIDVLYQQPPLIVGLIPSDQAAEWQGLAYHPVARAYFEGIGDR
jgi:TRAP transporter TAXI family solute receptor